ncbi:MAG: DNA primase [Chthonomonadales bacterium]|nr:DNA primase [Chthonomonadales bacterium]
MQVDKEEIRARSDIVEIIGAVVQLQRRGRNWVGLCPFHQEKTPSFNVDPVTQSFKCFGCGASGDVFTFVERHENMSFIEAAEHLARRAGVELARRGGGPPRPQGEREALFDANAAANTYFRKTLSQASAAIDYLARRGILPETVEKWQIGFAPDAWDGLLNYLVSRKFDLRVAERAGLIHKARTGNYVDAFRNRIIFPIHDDQQRIVGFGGRAMGDEPPKYLNTGETPIFTKSKLLFGLHHARKSMAEQGHALLMEGYTDVISAHQAGFTAAVATLGTSLTTEHAKRLARLSPRIVIVYDADSAGIKAALRAATELERESAQVRIVALPAGDDPDSLIRAGHADRLKRAIDNAVTRVQFELDLAVAAADQSTDEGRHELVRRVIAILATVPTRTERDLYIERVWQLHPLSVHGPALAKQQLHQDAEQVAGRKVTAIAPRQTFNHGRTRYESRRRDEGRSSGHGAFPGRGPNRQAVVPPPSTRVHASELLLVRALTSEGLRADALDMVTPDDLLHETDRRLFALVAKHRQALTDEASLMRLVRAQNDDQFSQDVADRLQESHAVTANEPLDAEVLSGAAKTIRERRLATVEAEIGAILKSRAVLTEDDRERVRQLQEVQSRLRGSA